MQREILILLVLASLPLIQHRRARGDDPVMDPAIAAMVTSGDFDVAVANRPKSWDRFRVFVWQHQTDAMADVGLYRSVGLDSFHIDRGVGQQPVVRFAVDQAMPYYVDHAAGKGFLHLTPRTGLDALRRDGSLQPRPQSLVTTEAIDLVCKTITDNVSVVVDGPACAIALDDEVSLASFNSPYEVDASPPSVSLYRRVLQSRYGSIERLNGQWSTHFTGFDEVDPVSFEDQRKRLSNVNFADWNLSSWIDWRSYMDDQFAASIARLVKHTVPISGGIPVGVVGGQQPSAFGGFDYAKLPRSVQWIESYDIGGTNELLTSLWNDSRKPITQTFFASGDPRRDRWFLNYYLAHGNAAVIAWPVVGGKPWFDSGKTHPAVTALASTFADVQSQPLSLLSDPNTHRVHDPVAILYSHASVQASWAADALVHGKTWPRRSSSMDNANSSAGRNRIGWNKLLEDIGIQARWISEAELADGVLQREDFRVVILPRTIAIGDAACVAVDRFVGAGGLAIADHFTAIMDEHGKSRATDVKVNGRLDELFGIVRHDDAGYFGGDTVTEVNGERYNDPFTDRLPARTLVNDGWNVVERGTRCDSDAFCQTFIRRGRSGAGASVYLNVSPVPYSDDTYRLSTDGDRWRKALAKIIHAVVPPKATVTRGGQPVVMAEVLHWRRDQEDYLVVIGNPSREAAIDGAGQMQFPIEAGTAILQTTLPYKSIVDARTGKTLSSNGSFSWDWSPDVVSVFRLVTK